MVNNDHNYIEDIINDEQVEGNQSTLTSKTQIKATQRLNLGNTADIDYFITAI